MLRQGHNQFVRQRAILDGLMRRPVFVVRGVNPAFEGFQLHDRHYLVSSHIMLHPIYHSWQAKRYCLPGNPR